MYQRNTDRPRTLRERSWSRSRDPYHVCSTKTLDSAYFLLDWLHFMAKSFQDKLALFLGGLITPSTNQLWYISVLDASPTELRTVQTTLKWSTESAQCAKTSGDGSILCQRHLCPGTLCHRGSRHMPSCAQVKGQMEIRDSMAKGGLIDFCWTKVQSTGGHWHSTRKQPSQWRSRTWQSRTWQQDSEQNWMKKRKEQDKKDVQSILSTIQNTMKPFDQTLGKKDNLYHIISVQVASEAISADL